MCPAHGGVGGPHCGCCTRAGCGATVTATAPTRVRPGHTPAPACDSHTDASHTNTHTHRDAHAHAQCVCQRPAARAHTTQAPHRGASAAAAQRCARAPLGLPPPARPRLCGVQESRAPRKSAHCCGGTSQAGTRTTVQHMRAHTQSAAAAAATAVPGVEVGAPRVCVLESQV